MNYYSFIPLTSFFVNVILAAVVFTLNPHSKINRSFSLFAIVASLWAFCHFIEWNETNENVVSFILYIEVIFWLPIVLYILNFLYALLGRKRGRAFWSMVGISVFWVTWGLATNGFVQSHYKTFWGVIDVFDIWYYPAVFLCNVVPAVYCFYLILRAIKKTNDPELRIQLKHLFVGLLSMYVLVMIESVVKTGILHVDTIPYFGSLFVIILSGFIFFSIVKHDFLSVNIRAAALDIFSQVQEGVIILDGHGLVREINQQAAQFFNIKDMLGKKNPLEMFQGYSSKENLSSREFSFISGDRICVCLVSQSELIDHGRTIGMLIILHDVTKLRDEEKKSRILEEQVGRSHASRLESLGQLSGGIAHDFNNIMAGIGGYSSLLMRKLSEGDQKLYGFAKGIYDLAMRASGLTKKLLTFARKTPVEMSVVDLHDLITETMSLLHHTVDKRIVFESKLEAATPTVKGDLTQLENMLLNIALNARDAMPAGGTVTFATHIEKSSQGFIHPDGEVSPPGEYLVVSIADTGTGMSEEIKERIFEPFFTTKDPGKGTGLGLASVYGISRMHDGYIKVDSVVGTGTTFHVYLPCSEINLAEPSLGVDPFEQGSGHILLVDDEASLREAISWMLMDCGYTVVACSSGAECLERLQQACMPFDLVILDVIMPGMTGDQCALRIKARDPAQKILFISGFAGKIGNLDSRDNAPEFVGPVLQKPFTPQSLGKAVALALSSRSSASPLIPS